MKNLLIVIAFLFSCFGAFANDQDSLELKEVIESATSNYPKILQYYQEVKAGEGTVLANKGFFDIRLQQKYFNKTRGYYDGAQSDTVITKRNKFLGSEIYGGYRKSWRDFENHETGRITNDDGEFRIGAKFSLLQNATIDETRLALTLSKLDLKEKQEFLRNIKNQIQLDATNAYYNWIEAGKIYNEYLGLYNLTVKRNEQIEVRVKKGDMAKITLIENQRNALNRKTAMVKALQDFENSAIMLSLFYRDEKGDSIIVKKEQLPDVNINSELTNLSIEKIESDFIFALRNRADVKILNIEKNKELANLKQAKNLYKPKLDLDISASNDVSNENNFRGQSKNEVMLNFEIPLQQRKAKGSIAKAKAKINSIKYQERLLKDIVKTSLQTVKNSINATAQMHENLVQETKFAQILEDSERTRFEKGESDFFLINLREQSRLRSKILAIATYTGYYKLIAKYRAEIFAN